MAKSLNDRKRYTVTSKFPIFLSQETKFTFRRLKFRDVNKGATYRGVGRVKGIKKGTWDFPGGAVVENLPANAGDTGSSPGLGRSHMPWSNWAREPQLLNLRVWSLCSAIREGATVRGLCTAMKSGPPSPQLEKALTQKRRPNTAKNK